MPRFTTAIFVTASVSSGGFLNHNEVLGNSAFDIVALKIVPSIVGSTTEVQVYERDTFLEADLLYSTNPFIATGFDPIQKDSGGTITEALRGFVAPYEDQDATGEFHIKILNNDSQAKTYTVTLVYEIVASTSVVNIDDLGDVTISAVASGEVLKWDGANWINNTLAEAGIAATGHVHSAADITTGLLAIARGGTGAATAQAAFDALSPLTTLGDVIFRDASNNVRLAGNTTTVKQYLSQTGDGAASAAPIWAAVDVSDITGGNVQNTGTPLNNQLAIWINATTVEGTAGLTYNGSTLALTGAMTISTDLTVTDQLIVSGAGPHAISGSTDDWIRFSIPGNFTSLGGSTKAVGQQFAGTITGANADTGGLLGTELINVLTTQTASENIAEVAQLKVHVPTINDNLTGDITDAATVIISAAPTAGLTNYALKITTGSVGILGAGPHSYGGFLLGYIQHRFGGTFVSDGASFLANSLLMDGTMIGAGGDTIQLIGMHLATRITTQTAEETVTDVAQLLLTEPNITDNLTGAGVITNASTLKINNAPTEATNNYAIWVDAGLSRFDGSIIIGDSALTNASAGLELDSTTLAVLVSRMTTGQRDALTAVNGMILYNSSLNQMHARVNGAWVDLSASGGGGFVDVSGTPTAGQLAEWVDADTIQGVDPESDESTSMALVLS